MSFYQIPAFPHLFKKIFMTQLHYFWFYYHFCNKICAYSIYSIKIFAEYFDIFNILKSQFIIGNLELFWNIAISVFYTKCYKWYSVWWYRKWTVENKVMFRNLILTGWHFEERDIILAFVLASIVLAMVLP